jgi:hypothetical protein
MSADHDSPHSPPAPPEPQTPTWLTVVGGVCFFIAAMWWLASVSADQRKAANPAGAGAEAAPAQSAAAR